MGMWFAKKFLLGKKGRQIWGQIIVSATPLGVLVQVIKLINVYLMITVGLVLCKAAGGSMMKIKPLGKSLPYTMSYV